MTETTTAPTPAAARRVALIVAGAFFMENLDGTVIVTALPQIGHSFGVTATDLSLSVTAYLLTLAAFIPTSSWVSDRFGSRTVFVAAVCLSPSPRRCAACRAGSGASSPHGCCRVSPPP